MVTKLRADYIRGWFLVHLTALLQLIRSDGRVMEVQKKTRKCHLTE
jgi:hypothetical protein